MNAIYELFLSSMNQIKDIKVLTSTMNFLFYFQLYEPKEAEINYYKSILNRNQTYFHYKKSFTFLFGAFN